MVYAIGPNLRDDGGSKIWPGHDASEAGKARSTDFEDMVFELGPQVTL